MARCDLRIELEPGQETRTLGETVRGEVVVETDGEVECKALVVRTMWATHGKGNKAVGPAETLTLFQGRWTGGPEMRYPFELSLPESGPAVYAGHYLNVGWFVHATADIPWKLDPHTEVSLDVRPSPDVEHDWRAQFPEESSIPSELQESSRAELLEKAATQQTGGSKVLGWVLGGGCLLIVLGAVVSFFGGAFVMLGQALSDVQRALQGEAGWGDIVPSLVILGIAAAIVAAIGAGIARVVVRKKRLGEVDLVVEPQIVQPGEEIRVTVRGQPGMTLQLNALTARLQGKEVVVRGSGTNKTTYTHELCDETHSLGGGRPLQARMPYQLEGTFRIPDDAPASFAASSNALRWTVRVDMDVAACPDWRGNKTLVVTPPS